MRLHRLGLHELAVTNARSKRRPSRASRERFGVRTAGLPNGSASSAPWSSAMRRTIFGGLATAGLAAIRHRSTTRRRRMAVSILPRTPPSQTERAMSQFLDFYHGEGVDSE